MTDLEIIKRIRAGHYLAYADLIERYQARVYVCASHYAAQDKLSEITAQAFVLAYPFVGNVQKEADFAVYLVRCAVNALKAAGVDADALCVWDSILKLEGQPRAALALRFGLGQSYEAIAQSLGCAEATVPELLAQAREAVLGLAACPDYRVKLQAYCDNEMMRMERMEVEVHAEGCEACVAFAQAMQEVFGDEAYADMPESVCDRVMALVEEEYGKEMENSPQQRENLEQKLNKNKNLRLWVLVGCVIVFGLFSWLFSLMAQNNLVNVDPSSQSQSMTGVTSDTLAGELARTIGDADAVFVEFGFSRVGVTEKAMILMFADYIAAQPVVEYQGAAASNSLGKIATEPMPGVSMTITSEHRLLVDDGETIWELQTTRDKLLDVLKALGV